MLEDLEELVVCESFSADHGAVARSAKVVADQGTRLLGARPETIVIDGVTHLRWSFGTPRVLLLGHHDTVWPIGTLATIPWSLVDGIARGPGVFDMKAGLVQTFHALAALPSLDGVCVLVTGDEEVGSPSSRTLIEETARECAAAFVLEAGADGGALKIARKGTSIYELAGARQGRARGARPGEGRERRRRTGPPDPRHRRDRRPGERRSSRQDDVGGRRHRRSTRKHGARDDRRHERSGAEAGRDLAGILGTTTVTPTVLSAGHGQHRARAGSRVGGRPGAHPRRAGTGRRADARPAPRIAGTRLEVSGGPNRPPLEEASSAALFAARPADRRRPGLAPLTGVGVGGASDGNYTAGVGCPTLDGLGAVGGGAHADTSTWS